MPSSISKKAINRMIYLDNAATAPALNDALEVFLKVNKDNFGNAASNHAFGHEADRILERSRLEILKILALETTHELIFTSGATESNNLAIKGLAFRYAKRGKRIITSAIEHPSVLNVFKQLHETFGYDVVILPVNSKGVVDPSTLSEAMSADTILVSIMAVNNEIGSINDIAGLAQVVHRYPKAYFHVDATQAICKVALPYQKADLLSFSGHKIGSVKGTGALIYRKKISFFPLNAGGEQESGYRAGTVDVAGAACLAKAIEIETRDLIKRRAIVEPFFQRVYAFMAKRDDVEINSPADALPYVINFSLLRKKASVVVEALSNEGIYVSSVSACSSKEASYSYVVEAIGKSRILAENSIRVSFSPLNTMAEIDIFLETFSRIMKEVSDR
jgi:cysteine desulfurase